MKSKKMYLSERVLIAAAFISGIFIVSYLKNLNNDTKFMPLEQLKQIEENIEIKESDIIKLIEQKNELNKILQKYEENNENIHRLLDEELLVLKNIAGVDKVKDSGITLEILDSQKEIELADNPNDFLVHDIDILRIVNDLKMAGAIAIEINGERILSNTPISCSGTTITIGNKIYSQPFIIKAAGEVDDLKASILSPNSYSQMLKSVYSIEINMRVSENLEINEQ